jgi:hypothetical protein
MLVTLPGGYGLKSGLRDFLATEAAALAGSK